MSLINHAEELAKQGAAGAKKIGAVAKQQLMRPVDKLTGDRLNTQRDNSVADSQFDMTCNAKLSNTARIKNFNDGLSMADVKTEFDMSATSNGEVVKLTSDAGNELR